MKDERGFFMPYTKLRNWRNIAVEWRRILWIFSTTFHTMHTHIISIYKKNKHLNIKYINYQKNAPYHFWHTACPIISAKNPTDFNYTSNNLWKYEVYQKMELCFTLQATFSKGIRYYDCSIGIPIARKCQCSGKQDNLRCCKRCDRWAAYRRQCHRERH